MLKTAQKLPFLDTKSAIERATRLEMIRNVFVVMRVCSQVALSYLDASFSATASLQGLWDPLVLCGACSGALTQKHPFFTPNGPREDTAVCKTPSSSPICTHLIV